MIYSYTQRTVSQICGVSTHFVLNGVLVIDVKEYKIIFLIITVKA